MSTRRLMVPLLSGLGVLAFASSRVLADDVHYYLVEPDPRMCVSPACGGFFVSELNTDFTVCADGSVADVCYVAEMNSDIPALADWAAQHCAGVVEGQILPKVIDPFGNLGQLILTEAWQPVAK